MAATPARIRNAQLGLIHQAKAALGYDDATYRQILQTQCGVTSAANLDDDGRDKVILYLRAQGWTPAKKPAKPKRRRDPAPAAGLAPMWKKIDAQLFSMGLTRAYLDGDIKAKLAGGIDAWRFADAAILRNVIAALAFQQQRTGAPTK